MALKFTKLKLSSPASNKGFTLVELLAATAIAAGVLVASLGLIADQRRRFVSDQVRAESNQTLRVGLDLVGADIKNSGDFLESDINFPVITVIDGPGGSADELILQRKLISDTLTVCEDVSGAKSTIIVARPPSNSNSDCPLFSDGNTDGLNDPLTLARRERCEQDGVAGCSRNAPPPANSCDDECVDAYIYDPVDQEGEFFQYAFEEVDDLAMPRLNEIHVGGTASFTNTYEVANNPIIVLLEERHYRLNNNNRLELIRNDGNPVELVNQVADFQVQAQLTTNPILQDSFNATPSPNEPTTYQRTMDWQSLEFVEVRIESVDPSDSVLTELRPERRELASRFYPRNALSRD